MSKLDHPNDPGKWTLLVSGDDKALWRRDRIDPVPVTLFYIIAPPQQPQILYDEHEARVMFEASHSAVR